MANPPMDFLDASERSRVFDQNKKLCISLYKTLFFEKVASAVKSGALNLRQLLNKAGLMKFREFTDLES